LITASLNGESRAVTATVLPRLADVGIDSWDLIGGSAATGTVTLSGPAPEGGLVVALSSDHPALTVPPSVTVPAGKTSVSFPVNTTAVSDETMVHISAACDGTVSLAWPTLWPD